MSSTFSEAVGVVKDSCLDGSGSCPLLRALGTAVDPPLPISAWTAPVAVTLQRRQMRDRTVRAAAVGYQLERTVTTEGHFVRVKDQLTTAGNRTRAAGYLPTGYVGIVVLHRVSFLGGAEQIQTDRARCCLAPRPTGHAIQLRKKKPHLPEIVYLSARPVPLQSTLTDSTLGGVGMIPLDDVLETHSFDNVNVSAYHTAKLRVQSDPPAWRRRSNVCGGPTA